MSTSQNSITTLGLLILALCLPFSMADISPSTSTQLAPLSSSIQPTPASSSSQSDFPTRTLFLPGFGVGSTYYGSIMTAAPEATVYSLACVHQLCAGLSSTGIFTQGPSTYTYAVMAWAYTNIFATMNCTLGPQDATCTSGGTWYPTTRSLGSSTPVVTTSWIYTYNGSSMSYQMATVIITAGADLLATATLTPASTPAWALPAQTTTRSSEGSARKAGFSVAFLMGAWLLILCCS